MKRGRILLPLAQAAPILIGVLLLTTGLAHAQSVSIDLGHAGESGATGRLVQLTALITTLSLAPSLLVMVTAFTRIVIVLSLLRGALGAAVLDHIRDLGLLDQAALDAVGLGGVGRQEQHVAVPEPFRHFMLLNVRPADLTLFLDIAKLPPSAPDATSWRALVPAFMIGELRRGFEMGFLLYMPFLVIDIVVSSVLMGLGMMMLPPSAVSLPFKLIFFVLIDGWHMIAGSLVQSFATQ